MSSPSHPYASGAAAPNRQQRALDAASEPVLARVIERARWLASLDTTLRQSLPATLADQVKLANVDDAHLVFLASSPTWKARLRQSSHLIEAAAASVGLASRTVVVKIVPALVPEPAPMRQGPALSDTARASLRATAQSVADPELRAQLLRLASLA